MTTLAKVIGDRPVRREDWRSLAEAWGVDSDYTLGDIAPDGVECKVCWDYGLCAECLGRYPDQCPVDCGDGRCPVCGKKAADAPGSMMMGDSADGR